jgi:hypothetical protein
MWRLVGCPRSPRGNKRNKKLVSYISPWLSVFCREDDVNELLDGAVKDRRCGSSSVQRLLGGPSSSRATSCPWPHALDVLLRPANCGTALLSPPSVSSSVVPSLPLCVCARACVCLCGRRHCRGRLHNCPTTVSRRHRRSQVECYRRPPALTVLLLSSGADGLRGRAPLFHSRLRRDD